MLALAAGAHEGAERVLGGRIVPKPVNARRDAQAEEEEGGEEVRFEPASGRILSVITAVVLAFLWPVVLGSCFTSTPMIVFSRDRRGNGRVALGGDRDG